MSDQAMSSCVRFCEIPVQKDPVPYTIRPIQNARLAPQRSPSLPPRSMNAAMTSVYMVMAVCMPTMVVLRSAATCEIDTFITVVSSTMMNWAAASMPMTPQPAVFSIGAALSVIAPPKLGVQAATSRFVLNSGRDAVRFRDSNPSPPPAIQV